MVRRSTAHKMVRRKAPRHVRVGRAVMKAVGSATMVPAMEEIVGAMANPDSGIKFVLGIAKRAGKRVSEVQSVIFDKLKWTAEAAKGWLRDHGFATPHVDQAATFLRFRQQSPGKYKEFRTIVPGTHHNPRGQRERHMDVIMSEHIHFPGFPQIVVTRAFAYSWFKSHGWREVGHGPGSLEYMVFMKPTTDEPLMDAATRDEWLSDPQVVKDLGRENPRYHPSPMRDWRSEARTIEVTNGAEIVSLELRADGRHAISMPDQEPFRKSGNVWLDATDAEWTLVADGRRHGNPDRASGLFRVTADEVSDFKHSWPASGLPNDHDFYFEFASNGDIVDLWAQPEGTKLAPIGRNHKDTTRWDGPALVALSQDAQEGKRGSRVNPGPSGRYLVQVKAYPVNKWSTVKSFGDEDRARQFADEARHTFVNADTKIRVISFSSYDRELMEEGNPAPDVADAITSYDEHLGMTTRPEFQEATPDEQAAAMTAMDLAENPADPAQVMQAYGWRPGAGVGAGWVHSDHPGHSFHTSSSGAWDHRLEGSNVSFGDTVQELEAHLSGMGKEENPAPDWPEEWKAKVDSLLRDWHEAGRAEFQGHYPNLDYDQDSGKLVSYKQRWAMLDQRTGPGRSGAFMLDRESGNIYRIKSAYGVPNYKKLVGHISTVTGQDLYRRRWNPEENPMSLHDRLVHAVTEHDRKQEGKRGYNRYALPQYLNAVSNVTEEIGRGYSVRSAIINNFTGRLADVLLRVAEEAPTTREEQMGSPVREERNPMLPISSDPDVQAHIDAHAGGRWFYTPSQAIPGRGESEASFHYGTLSDVFTGARGKAAYTGKPAFFGTYHTGHEAPRTTGHALAVWPDGRVTWASGVPASQGNPDWYTEAREKKHHQKFLPPVIHIWKGWEGSGSQYREFWRVTFAERAKPSKGGGVSSYGYMHALNNEFPTVEAATEWARSVIGGPEWPVALWQQATVQIHRKHWDPAGDVLQANPSSDLGQAAFDAAKEFHLSGAYSETGVANARVAKYGFNKWYSSLTKWQLGPRGTRAHRKSRLLKNWMEGWAAGKRVEKRQGNPERQQYEIVEHRRGVLPMGLGYYDSWEEADKVARQMSRFMANSNYWIELRPYPYQEGEGGAYRGGQKVKGKHNPEPAAAALYEEFHGIEPAHTKEIITERQEHEWLTQLGTLVELKVATVTGLDATISFAKDKNAPDLCSSEDGRQLYIEGGDQALDLQALKMAGDKWRKDSMVIGVLYELTYQTKKGFHNFKLTDYFHKLGEETGEQPTLLYDPNNKLLSVSGGAYKVLPEGIVN